MSKPISFSGYLTQVEEVIEQLQSGKSELTDSEVIETVSLLIEGLVHLPSTVNTPLEFVGN